MIFDFFGKFDVTHNQHHRVVEHHVVAALAFRGGKDPFGSDVRMLGDAQEEQVVFVVEEHQAVRFVGVGHDHGIGLHLVEQGEAPEGFVGVGNKGSPEPEIVKQFPDFWRHHAVGKIFRHNTKI